MDNRVIQEAKRYHEVTKHSYWSVRHSAHYLDWDIRPSPFKDYPDLSPLPLASDFSPPASDTLRAMGSAECNDDKSLSLKELSQLLFFSAGLTKKKTYPGGEEHHFRAAACAGALYPIEIYLASTDIPGLEAGVYHFNPRDFALRKIRHGDYRPALTRAAGDNQAIAAAPATLILSAIFWRSSWKYQARSYRYCFWDCGTILANLLAVASGQEIPCSVEMGFLDSKVNRLLGLDGEREASLCLVPLGRGLEWARHAGSEEPPPIAHKVAALSHKEVEYPAIKRMHASSCLTEEDEIRPWRGPCLRAEENIDNPTISLGPPLEQSRPLGETILKRASTRRFARRAISLSQLSTILKGSTGGIPADFLEGPETSLPDLYLIINAVEGLDTGAYYFSPAQKKLEPIKTGSFRDHAGYLCLEQELPADASVVFFFLGDLNRVLNRFGNRGYRAAQLEAGITGGRIYLSAYSLGLGATGLTFYDDDVVKFFSPHAGGKDAIFVVAVGKAGTSRHGLVQIAK